MADMIPAAGAANSGASSGTHNSTTVQSQTAGSTIPQASTTTGVSPSASQNTAPAGASVGDWMTGFDDAAKGYVANKGFKGPSDMLNSYQNLEKAMGVPQDRLLKLPEDMSTPEGRAVWERLGAPKDAAGYEAKNWLPTENADPKLMETMANNFAEIGVPKGMADKIVSKWNEYVAQGNTATTEAIKAQADTAEKNLRAEWGQKYEQNRNMIDAAARNLGLGKDEVNALARALGNEKAAKALFKIGSGIGEHGFTAGTPAGTGVLNAGQAQAKIAELKADPSFTQRYLAGDGAARKEMQRFMEMAYPGERSI